MNRSSNFQILQGADYRMGEVSSAENTDLKRGIYLYFFLLIFEGALRKWVFPSLATPLLIVRDPIALWLIFRTIQSGVYKPNFYILIAWMVTIVSFYATLLVGHGSLAVALYGFRIFILHFPLLFIIGKVLNKEEVEKIIYILLWIHIGMTILVAVQFFSPQSSWVNRGIGGNIDGSGFSGAAGYFRVPGTFSFTNGLSAFYGLVAAVIFYSWIDKDAKVPKPLLIIASFFLLAAIPLSVSRSVFFQVINVMIFSVLTTTKRPKTIFRIIATFLTGFILLYFLSSISFFKTAVAVFTERFETANRMEGGIEGVLVDRFLGGMIGAVTNDTDTEFLGKGVGLGTNAGAKLLTGKTNYQISEGEWGRLVGEMGFFLGYIIILVRVVLVVNLFRLVWRALGRNNNLPWILFSVVAIPILQGQWAQPTALGFAISAGGLLLGSLNDKRIEVKNT